MKDNRKVTHQQQVTPVDWGEISRRLEAAQTAMQQGGEPSSEEQNHILKARAQALAQELQAHQAAAEVIEIVEFLLAHETYGVESLYVREVYPLKEFTPLPGTPPFVLGIINVRGQILSVIDLKKFFDLPEKGLTDLNKVIILRDDHMEFGLLADAILGVRSLPRKDLQLSLPTLTGIREAYLKGVTSERVVIVDAQKLLSDRKLIVHEEGEA